MARITRAGRSWLNTQSAATMPPTEAIPAANPTNIPEPNNLGLLLRNEAWNLGQLKKRKGDY